MLGIFIVMLRILIVRLDFVVLLVYVFLWGARGGAVG
jgi:hypothetical protein